MNVENNHFSWFAGIAEEKCYKQTLPSPMLAFIRRQSTTSGTQTSGNVIDQENNMAPDGANTSGNAVISGTTSSTKSDVTAVTFGEYDNEKAVQTVWSKNLLF